MSLSISYEYAKANYHKLYQEAIKKGEKFSLFNFKKHILSADIRQRAKFYLEMKKNPIYKKKIAWKRKLRSLLRKKLRSILSRCISPGCNKYEYYGGRGIKCYLNLDQLEFLWHRDNAASLKRPSIDRIDKDGNYDLSNCRFIELSENIARSDHPKKLFCKVCNKPRPPQLNLAFCDIHYREYYRNNYYEKKTRQAITKNSMLSIMSIRKAKFKTEPKWCTICLKPLKYQRSTRLYCSDTCSLVGWAEKMKKKIREVKP